nr:transposase [uncultured Prevotella sp.]
MRQSKWNAQQQTRAEILFQMFPKLKKAYDLYLSLVDIFNKKTQPGVARLKNPNRGSPLLGFSFYICFSDIYLTSTFLDVPSLILTTLMPF